MHVRDRRMGLISTRVQANPKEACISYVISRIGGRRDDSTDPSCTSLGAGFSSCEPTPTMRRLAIYHDHYAASRLRRPPFPLCPPLPTTSCDRIATFTRNTLYATRPK